MQAEVSQSGIKQPKEMQKSSKLNYKANKRDKCKKRLIEAKNKKIGDYFRLEQTKEGLRFNDAEEKERDRNKSENERMDKPSI